MALLNAKETLRVVIIPFQAEICSQEFHLAPRKSSCILSNALCNAVFHPTFPKEKERDHVLVQDAPEIPRHN